MAAESSPSTDEVFRIVQSSPTSVSVTTNSSVILPANPDRKLVTIVNRGSAIVYLNYGATAIVNAGIGLNPGGSSHVLNTREINYKGVISAVTSSGTAMLEMMESI